MSLTSSQGGNFQQQVLCSFTALWLTREQWAGCLVLSCGLGEAGAALALAAHIAGAVCLSIEPDPELLKAAQRLGACDFVVHTLDEAVRTMKNEARKGLPLGVGLQGSPAAVLSEVLERGLLPVVAADLSSPAADLGPAMSRLQHQGVQILDFGRRKTGKESIYKTIGEAIDGKALVEQGTRRMLWNLYCLSCRNRADLAKLDKALQGLLQPSETLRARWLQQAHLHFRHERPLTRMAWLTENEWSRLHDTHQMAP